MMPTVFKSIIRAIGAFTAQGPSKRFYTQWKVFPSEA
jgi:hypothetical protein